jgi:hypothetical protein
MRIYRSQNAHIRKLSSVYAHLRKQNGIYGRKLLYMCILAYVYVHVRKSQKNTSCKSLNTYLSRYLCSVNLGFLLSFCTNSSSFVFNHLLISAFIGFHGLIIPFYTFILCMFLPWSHPLNPVQFQPATEPFVGFDLLLLGLTQVLLSNMFPKKPSKLSALLVN